jgi:hypothetical protein
VKADGTIGAHKRLGRNGYSRLGSCPGVDQKPALLPANFRAAGFSGEFQLDVTCSQPDEWRVRTPCLLGNTGWMVLRVNQDGSATLLRKDAAAVVEAFTRKPGSVEPPDLGRWLGREG